VVGAFVHWRISRLARVRARGILWAMLEASDAQTLDTPPAQQGVVQELRDLIERLQGELKFHQTRNEALNFEIARLKRWRFGSSSASLETSTQAVQFDRILA